MQSTDEKTSITYSIMMLMKFTDLSQSDFSKREIRLYNLLNIHLNYLGGKGVRLVKISFHKKSQKIDIISGYLITFLESNLKK